MDRHFAIITFNRVIADERVEPSIEICTIEFGLNSLEARLPLIGHPKDDIATVGVMKCYRVFDYIAKFGIECLPDFVGHLFWEAGKLLFVVP
ncbi:hypothetical protein A6U96_10275 [Agrobacterium tumefaciens]|nr:hypothetical protein A6U96_10275 [Agrobacterium tumefaciens]